MTKKICEAQEGDVLVYVGSERRWWTSGGRYEVKFGPDENDLVIYDNEGDYRRVAVDDFIAYNFEYAEPELPDGYEEAEYINSLYDDFKPGTSVIVSPSVVSDGPGGPLLLGADVKSDEVYTVVKFLGDKGNPSYDGKCVQISPGRGKDDCWYVSAEALAIRELANAADEPEVQPGGIIQYTGEPPVVQPASDPVYQPTHYARFAIEPITFINANKLPYNIGNVVKYVCRYDAKDGLQDLLKARRYIDIQIETMAREQRVLNGEPVGDVWKVAL